MSKHGGLALGQSLSCLGQKQVRAVRGILTLLAPGAAGWGLGLRESSHHLFFSVVCFYSVIFYVL